jgi:Glu-tRNA(Gln) amidotransferase subunit E-like FAD-binding protein
MSNNKWKKESVSKMRKTWISFLTALMLAIPTVVLAANRDSNSAQQGSAIEANHPMGHEHMFKHGKLDEQKWMEIVKRYTPDQADEWKKVLDERKQLRAKLQDEQVKKALKAKCEEMKKKREAALDQLIDRFANKKITKEQFKQELKQLHKKKKWMSKEEKQKLRELHHKTYEAMKANDKAALAALLPQWLEHMKKENERLAKWIQEATQR